MMTIRLQTISSISGLVVDEVRSVDPGPSILDFDCRKVQARISRKSILSLGDKGIAMELVPVESRGIESVGYDRRTQILVVVFRKGRAYRYIGVPENVYDELINAASKGRFFLSNIKEIYEYQEG